MNKKLCKTLGLAILLASSLPFSLVSAETVEEVPTGETTISSMADDPLKEYKEKAANQVSTIKEPTREEPESEPKKETETQTTEDTPTTESSAEDTPDTGEKVKRQPRGGGGIRPFSTNLIEDPGPSQNIDADFAQLLRTNPGVQDLGPTWSGYGKAKNQLTDDDMADLTSINIGWTSLTSLKGIEHAKNLENLETKNSQLASLDITQNLKLTYLDCTSSQLTNLDVTQNLDLIDLRLDRNQLTSLDVSQNQKLERLYCMGNAIGSLDVSQNPKLEDFQCGANPLANLNLNGADSLKSLTCANNQLSMLDVSQNPLLVSLSCGVNQLSNLDLSNNNKLQSLKCERNQLVNLNLAGTNELKTLDCQQNKLPILDISQCTNIETVRCDVNQIGSLNVSQNLKLKSLNCSRNQITGIDVSKNILLETLDCSSNQLTSLITVGAVALRSIIAASCSLNAVNVNQNLNLTHLNFNDNDLTNIVITNLTNLANLDCSSNDLNNVDVSNNYQLTELNFSYNKISTFVGHGATNLRYLDCNFNELTQLNLEQNLALERINCTANKLAEIAIGQNYSLQKVNIEDNNFTNLSSFNECENLSSLKANRNQINDITAIYGLTQLSEFSVGYQELYVPVPSVTAGKATVDILKTTAHLGLNATNGNISGSPIFSTSGDIVTISNVTRESLSERYMLFDYDDNQLAEGAFSANKFFSGTIRFFTVSELSNDLEPDHKKIKSGGTITWTWTIDCLTNKKAENIFAKLDLPVGLVIDSSTIEIDGVSASISDIDGTNNLGDLAKDERLVIKFKTTATGNADEWLKAKTTLDWEDDTISSPYTNHSEGAVQILDDEQTYTPKDNNFMGLLSVPIYFNYGVKNIQSSAQTYGLDSVDYQSNTKVVTDGFYTRIKDDRTISTGWKLTAKLSDFRDSSNTPMPNGTGTSLKLENMSIERVTNRDTPQEVIDPSPSGTDVPSSVQSTETIVAGQPTAKTLVTAQPNQGQDTWQLRMPFDKISLNVPANAGKKGTVYKAKLTWSLDDTP
jgi:Leucine-rich repeat (LRR) protein